MQSPTQPALTASPTSIQQGPPAPPSSTQRALPGRNVDSASIEDAYVAFILCCNPAVPLETDTAALREAFRTPPKSGGKSFSTFTLFELIKKLESKELKTWAELALKLGVEPPDQEKGQSSQKIQQYAVRLKRWMHSMHVDVFFDYLIGRQSPYWVDIPPAHTPIAELERDGVAPEDDMALRALLPQIKPRRVRRKPEDDDAARSPPRRPSPQADEHGSRARQNGAEPWTAQPDGRGSVFLFPPAPDHTRLHPSGASWGNSDVAQTPLTAYPIPQSAITPVTRNSFWADEPKSAITPSKPRPASRRHGAKVVSSAWRSGGIGTSGKTRGRPPINRGVNNEGPFSAFPTSSEAPSFRFPSPSPDTNGTSSNFAAQAPNDKPLPSTSIIPPSETAPQAVQNQSQPSPIHESAPPRPAKRSRLSLQVPERVGGEVRLATPPLPEPAAPPVLIVNGQASETQDLTGRTSDDSQAGGNNINNNTLRPFTCASTCHLPMTTSPARPPISLHDPTDRTHMDELEALFIAEILRADWFDARHNRVPACGVAEAAALAQTVVENLLAAAATREAFLVDLAALAGRQVLMSRGSSLRVTRLEELPDRTRYACSWELRYGDIVGRWTREDTVMHCRWKRGREGEGIEGDGTDAAKDGGGSGGGGDGEASRPEEEHWERKYRELAARMQQRDQEMIRLKAKLIDSIRDC
ncbi:hypothetical protein VTK56DRAFT_420 [Thermocarpiscus australiensis]